MAAPMTLDVGRAAAYVRGMADAVRQVLAGDPEPDRPVRLRADFTIILGGRPSGCGIDPVARMCWPRLKVPPEDFVTIGELGDALAGVVAVADALHQSLDGREVSPELIEEVGRIIGPPR
jgi:hypothetical protein